MLGVGEAQQLEAAVAQRVAERQVTPAAFADDMRLSGPVDKCLEKYGVVLNEGPAYGVFLCETKTELVVLPQHVGAAKALVDASPYPGIKVVTAARNLGSLLGPQDEKDAFAKAKAEEWAALVKQLATIAPKDPHSVHAVYTSCLKPRWTFQQRVLETHAPREVYKPIEEAITDYLIPALTGWRSELTQAEREMLSLPAREGGMGIEDPTQTATANYEASTKATAVMQRMIVKCTDMQTEDFFEHNRHMARTASAAKQARCEAQKALADALCEPQWAWRGRNAGPYVGRASTRQVHS